jgi:hypothetical protein
VPPPEPAKLEEEKNMNDTQTSQFVSGDNNLGLVRKPTTRRMNERGEWETAHGIKYEFRGGVLNVDSDQDVIDGVSAADWLRDHEQFNRLFWERGNEPGRVPDSTGLLEQVVELAVDGDADKLAEIYVAERNTHSRRDVLKAIEAAIEKLDGEQPEPDPIPDHQLERTRVGASAREHDEVEGEGPVAEPGAGALDTGPAESADETEGGSAPGSLPAPEEPGDSPDSPENPASEDNREPA